MPKLLTKYFHDANSVVSIKKYYFISIFLSQKLIYISCVVIEKSWVFNMPILILEQLKNYFVC